MTSLDTIAPDELRTLLDDPLALDERDDGPVLIPKLPAQTFVRIARQLREENRLELLLPFATPDQLTSLLDLDGWTGDRINLPRAREWMHAIAESYTSGDRPRGALADLMYTMDPELWTMVVGAGMAVFEIAVDEDDSLDHAANALAHFRTWETPDGFFLVGVTDDEIGRAALRTLTHIYDDDLAEGRKICLAISALLPSQSEEDCLRWRSSRLADLGFVSWEEAMRLFRPLDHKAAVLRPAENFDYLGEPDALERPVEWSGPDLLRRVMAKLSPEQHGIRSREFLLLVNEVMAAQRLDPGDEALQGQAIDQTQATITLGLELLDSAAPTAAAQSDASEPAAVDTGSVDTGAVDTEAVDTGAVVLAERITALGLRQIFQVGYGALDKLRKAAQSLHTQGRVSLSSPGSLLDRPWGPAIETFCRLYPELPLPSTSRGTRALANLADVARATTLIAESAALANLTFAPEGYGVDPTWIGRIDEPEQLKLGDLIRTAIVHMHLPGSNTAFAPLTMDDVAWAAKNLLTADRLIPAVRADFSQRCGALGIGPQQETLAANLLTRLEAELASLEVDEDGNADLTRLRGFVTIQSVGVWLRTRHGEA